eukprot:5680877-Pyramimonas_sp.AAC.1
MFSGTSPGARSTTHASAAAASTVHLRAPTAVGRPAACGRPGRNPRAGDLWCHLCSKVASRECSRFDAGACVDRIFRAGKMR